MYIEDENQKVVSIGFDITGNGPKVFVVKEDLVAMLLDKSGSSSLNQAGVDYSVVAKKGFRGRIEIRFSAKDRQRCIFDKTVTVYNRNRANIVKRLG